MPARTGEDLGKHDKPNLSHASSYNASWEILSFLSIVACSSETQEGTTSTTALPSFWGVAASLADTVKKNTAEITAGLKETNWRAELEAFSKGVREEEQVLRHETAKRVEVAKEHLPKDVRLCITVIATAWTVAVRVVFRETFPAKRILHRRQSCFASTIELTLSG